MGLNFKYDFDGGLVLVEFWINEQEVSYEIGPSEATARSHEGIGGSQEIKAFINSPYPWIADFPGLHSKIVAEIKKAGFVK